MSNPEHRTQPSFGEFVALMAMMMSLAALSTDAMLPALSQIGLDLAVQRQNSVQLVVSLLFLGMAGGQMLFGPLSDSTGRKPAVVAGYGLFIIGCLLSIFTASFSVMLLGRLLQGIGIAAPRSVTLALIRDIYEGRAMARVMSFVMTVFILVPVIAPAFGQAILLVADWRAIFAMLLALAIVSLLWFVIRQPETLPASRRMPFSLVRILGAVRHVLGNRIALGHTIAAGLISGAFLGYLNSSQQIFQSQYGLGTRFPLFFAVLALAIGCASFLNGRLVIRYGMRALSAWSSQTLAGLSLLYFVFAFAMAGNPPLWTLMAYLLPSFFCVGILFGNLNSIAMQPLGQIAGVGAAVIGSLSLLIAVPLAMLIGQSYNGTILPLVAGFLVLSLMAALVIRWAGHRRPIPSPSTPRP